MNTFLPRSDEDADPFAAFHEILEETISSVKEADGDAMNPFGLCPACGHLFQKRLGSPCGRCQRTRYCTSKCRLADWAQHRDSCIARCRVCDEVLVERVCRCARCQGVYYCGAECQGADWPSHRNQCQ